MLLSEKSDDIINGYISNGDRQNNFDIKSSDIFLKARTKIHPGTNVGLGRDYTIFAKIDGVVTFERFDKKRKQVSVYAAAQA